MGSASTRPSAASTSTRSTESGSTRDRISLSASSTVSTRLLYYTPPRSAGGRDGCAPRDHASRYRARLNWVVLAQATLTTRFAGGTPVPAPQPTAAMLLAVPKSTSRLRAVVQCVAGLVAGVREIQDGLEAAEEPASAQHEQREEPGGDREVAQPERQPGRGRDRRKHDEHPLEEDRDKPEDRDHEERGVSLGGPTGEPFDEVRERDQPADDQHHPGKRQPRLDEQPLDEEPRLDRYVAVPDHEVLREEEVHPHDRHGELQLGHILHRGRRDRGPPARVGPDGEDRQEAERRVERADGEVAAEEAAVPLRVERHHEVEPPERHRHEPQHEKDDGDAVPSDALAPVVRRYRIAEQ